MIFHQHIKKSEEHRAGLQAGFDDLCRFAQRLFSPNEEDELTGEAAIVQRACEHGWLDRKGNITDAGATLLRALKESEGPAPDPR